MRRQRGYYNFRAPDGGEGLTLKGDGAYAQTIAREELGIVPDEKEIANLEFEQAVQSPQIKQTAGVIKFWWPTEQIEAQISRAHQHKDGRVTAELKFSTSMPGFPRNLHQCQINLVATRAKKDLAAALAERRNDIDKAEWESIIEEMTWEILERLRQGEPVIEISTLDEVPPMSYLVEPFVIEDEPTVIYGLGGCGKSTMALLMAMTVQLGWKDNPLMLKVTDRKGVLYLDWETSFKAITRRMKAIRKGMNMTSFLSLHYRRCSMPLADDTAAIQRAILDNNIGFVVIDSVAAACGGDLNAADPAIRMFAALRELKVTSLLIAHTSKNSATKDTTVYGSGFFNYYARSVWEMKKVQQPGAKGLKVGLYHRKANDSELYNPYGFEIKWDKVKETAIILPTDVDMVPELAPEKSAKETIKKYLGIHGRAGTMKIAEALALADTIVRARLNEMEKAGQVVKLGTEWALLHSED